MIVVIAPDSFKESLTATQASSALDRAARSVGVTETRIVPISDGGEGFLQCMSSALNLDLISVPTLDALGRDCVATIGILDHLAVFDVASAIGLELITVSDRDVLRSSSYGLGPLVQAALERGATRIVVGLGGSATNDCGAGLLAALGARFLDAAGQPVPPIPAELDRVAKVDITGIDPRVHEVEWLVACDVDNPLTGNSGASATFGPQKGATSEQVPQLDALLGRLAALLGGDPNQPGAGAAGGLGFAFQFLGGKLQPGADVVAQAVGLDDALVGADLVLTGEGSVDAQTGYGKAPAGVLRRAAALGIPVLVFGGQIKEGADVLLSQGATELIEISTGLSLEDALAQGPTRLEQAARRALLRYF